MGQSSASESESPVASGALLGSSIVEFSTVGAGLTRHHPVRVIRRMMLQDKAYSRSLTSSKTKNPVGPDVLHRKDDEGYAYFLKL
jgi:hypothetical protein